MHNIKDIRQNPNKFKEDLNNRYVDLDLNIIFSLDEKNRKLIQEKENLEKEKKNISKTKDPSLFEKSKKISEKIDKYIKEQLNLKKELDKILSSIPNIALEDVPVGKDEKYNKEKSPELLSYLTLFIEKFYHDLCLLDVKNSNNYFSISFNLLTCPILKIITSFLLKLYFSAFSLNLTGGSIIGSRDKTTVPQCIPIIFLLFNRDGG